MFDFEPIIDMLSNSSVAIGTDPRLPSSPIFFMNKKQDRVRVKVVALMALSSLKLQYYKDMLMPQQNEISQLRSMIDGSRRLVVFTGAGISTESGIPDFRSPGGLWTRYKPIDFRDFMADEEKRRESWRQSTLRDPTSSLTESIFFSRR